MSWKAALAVFVFAIGLVYFGVRGPYRAIAALDAYDYASVFGATQAWSHGENPYDMDNVRHELLSSGRQGGKMADVPPSIYLPATMPITAAFSWLTWPAAKVAWVCVSMFVFALSLTFVISQAPISTSSRILLAGGALIFSPTTSGLSTGNASVITCGFCLLALHFAFQERMWMAGLMLGLASCFKPQDSILVAAVFLLWRCWRALGISLALPAGALAASVWRAGSINAFLVWIRACQAAAAGTFATGGLSDPRPGNPFSYHIITLPSLAGLFTPDLKVENMISWVVAGSVLAIYLALRRRADEPERKWRDLAFFSALTLMLVYHRYYDAQLLLASVPFLLRYWRAHPVSVAVYAGCLAVLCFPLQPIFAQKFPGADPRTISGFLMLRHEPVLILLMTLVMIPWGGLALRKPTAERELERVPAFAD